MVPTDVLITGPTREPMDLEEVKKELQFTSDTDDTLLDHWIAAARQQFEEGTGRQLMTATWERWLDGFPCGPIELPYAPLQAVVSVRYLDGDGVEQTLVENTDYLVIAPTGPQCDRGWIEPAYGTTWPATRCQSGAVKVRFRAGYGNTLGDVPELIESALQLLVSNFHCNRCVAEGSTARVTPPLGFPDIIRSFRSESKKPLVRAWPMGGRY